MAKRKRGVGKATQADPAPPAPAEDAQFETSNLSLHDLFGQQMRSMLDSTDLDEEAKQSIMIAASCPCCGAGAMSFTAKIKRRT